MLLDGIGDHAIYMLDPQGRIASWNTGAARIKGYRAEEVLGKSIAMFYLPADIARGVPEHGLQEALIHGRYEAEGQRVRKDGSTFWAHVALFPIFDSRKQLLGFAKVLRDISERKRSEKAMEESLRVSEAARQELADFKYAIDQHSIVASTDVRGRITYVNDKFCAISQYSRDELIGQDHRIINSGHHPKQFFRELYQTVARGQVWHAEVCNRAKDGTFYWVDTTVVPLMNAEGKPQQYIAIRTDITELKHAGQTLREQAVVLELTQVFVRDLESRIVLWNQGTADLYGFSKEEATGRISHELLRTEFPKPLADIEGDFARDGFWEGELVHHKKDGEAIAVTSMWLLQRDSRGCPFRILETNVDITQRKKDEREIRRLKDEMEERVIQRTAQLQAANRELEAFTYSVSHDLRAPLRHIAGFSGILMEEFGTEFSPEARRYLERISEGTKRMGRLVDEMLNLARVGRYELHAQETNLNTLIDELIPMLHPECQERTVDWDVVKMTPVRCDPVLIKQVLQNLLSNALKFTRTRERAIIAVGEIQCGLDTAVFVRDNGVGFDMKYADKLFGVFQRLHRAEDFEGTGVGLATVHRIVQKHGGRIWAESVPDKGTTFYFTLGTVTRTEPANEAGTAIGASS